VLLLPSSMGIHRLAWGALIGSLLHLLVQLPDLLRQQGRYTFTLGRGMAEVREVITLMGPRILGVAVVQLNFIVNTIIALSLPEGSVSAISLAFTWMMMPEVAIAQSVAVAAMPTFSAQTALGKLDELRSSLASSVRGVLLLALPASVGLILLRTPLIRVLYEGGSFTGHSTEMVAWALLWYAAGLVGHSVLEVIVRAFYALHDTRTPVTVGVVAMSLNVALSFGFAHLFAVWGWMPHGGLALANSLATLLEVSTLIVFLRRRMNGLGGAAMPRALVQGSLGALGMGLAVWGWLALTPSLPEVLRLIGGALLGVGTYAAAMLALRVPELRGLLSVLKGRLKRKAE